MTDELFDEAIEIANEIREENNKEASRICEEIIWWVDFDKYKELWTSVVVWVYVRKWRDVNSMWWNFWLKTSKWRAIDDIHKFLFNTNATYIDWLNSEE